MDARCLLLSQALTSARVRVRVRLGVRVRVRVRVRLGVRVGVRVRVRDGRTVSILEPGLDVCACDPPPTLHSIQFCTHRQTQTQMHAHVTSLQLPPYLPSLHDGTVKEPICTNVKV